MYMKLFITTTYFQYKIKMTIIVHNKSSDKRNHDHDNGDLKQVKDIISMREE